MRFGSQREHPRHLVAGDRAGHPAEAGGSARHRAHPHAPAHAHHAEPAELQEVPLPLRLRRSRVAFALAVTVAAVPILVMDNLPATAEPDHGSVEAAGGPTTEMSIVLLEPSTTSTVAPAPTTTAAPATTAAPTTEAPTTTEAVVVQRVAVASPTTERPAPTTTTAPSAPRAGDPSDPATWDKLAQCEAGGNWAANTGNGYYGGLQFSLSTWQDVGGSGYPHQASKAEQIKRGKILQSRAGWSAWPTCAKKLGYY